MSAQKPSSKHHYIPRFLLAQWASRGGKLQRFVRPVDGKIAIKSVAPAEVGYRKDLYTTPGLPPDAMQQIEERFLSPLDAQAAETHRLLLAGRIVGMPQKQRSAWSRFLMSLWFRTPHGLRHFKEAMRLVLTTRDEALNTRYEALRRDGYPDRIEQIIAMAGPEVAERLALDLFRKMSDDPGNGLRLNNMIWFTVPIEGGRELLVSDAALHESAAGVFSPAGYMTMPIAPRTLFVAVNRRTLAAQITEMPRNEVTGRNNRAVVRRASVFVAATDLSQRRFITDNFGAEEHQTMISRIAERYRAQIDQVER